MFTKAMPALGTLVQVATMSGTPMLPAEVALCLQDKGLCVQQHRGHIWTAETQDNPKHGQASKSRPPLYLMPQMLLERKISGPVLMPS